MQIKLPEEVVFILHTLGKNGFEAFVVGGCVRDSLSGKEPHDWDITTSALPEEVKRCFERTIDTGIRHGTVTVRVNHQSFEVTTYRVDGEYENNRKPKQVSFTDDITLDLSRRDFTVNAMAYHPVCGLVDPFGGEEDIRRKIIRCVGDPQQRFEEDALRMLRAVRFSAQTGFSIEENTLHAIHRKHTLIANISIERIREELNKILLSDDVMKLKILYDTGILRDILPELCDCFETEQHIKYHIYDVGTHSLHVTQNVPKKLYLRWAALLHDLGKPAKKTTDEDGVDHFKGHGEVSVQLAADICRRFKMDNRSTDKILRLIKYHDREIINRKKTVKRAVLDVGEDIYLDLLDLKRGDAKGQNLVWSAPRLGHYDELERIYYECKAEQEAFSLRDLAVSGNDIKNMGFQGKEIGLILSHLLLYILDNPEDNRLDTIHEIIEKNKKEWLEMP